MDACHNESDRYRIETPWRLKTISKSFADFVKLTPFRRTFMAQNGTVRAVSGDIELRKS